MVRQGRREEAFQIEEGAGLEYQAISFYWVDNGEPLKYFELESDLVTESKEGNGKISVCTEQWGQVKCISNKRNKK